MTVPVQGVIGSEIQAHIGYDMLVTLAGGLVGVDASVGQVVRGPTHAHHGLLLGAHLRRHLRVGIHATRVAHARLLLLHQLAAPCLRHGLLEYRRT